ncbi:MAG: glutamate--tRNA ligase [Acidimicrobiales bacterium]
MNTPRVRFAPAPTGSLHLGSARSALFNWLYARSTGGTLVLRIEDTDLDRSKDEHVQTILRTFDWLGIDFDEGPYRQSERRDLYDAAIAKLLADGNAYYCDQTQEQIQARAKESGRPGYDGYSRDRGLGPGSGHVVRFRTADEGQTSFADEVRGEVVFQNENIEDFVIQRANGTPMFLVANAVDDAEMGITHVIRGEDLVNTTPKVIMLRKALGYEGVPVYAHLPLIVNQQRKKLSKRRDDVAVEQYRDRGFLAEAMVNYLATLGWGPSDGVEIRPVGEIIEQFRLEEITKSPAAFDVKKLTHFNGEYIRQLSPDDFLIQVSPFLSATDLWPAERFDAETFARIAQPVQERLKLLSDAPQMVDFLFVDMPVMDEASWDKAMVKGPSAVDMLDGATKIYANCEWSAEELHAATLALGEQLGLKLGKAQAPIRVAVTGRTVGPPLFESLEVLGRERTLDRIAAARERLE